MTQHEPALKTYYLVYGLLLAGLVATVGAAYVPLGRWNDVVALAIAMAKASLIVLIFMHVRYSPRLTWLAVFSGLVWLAILLTLIFADYATRPWLPTRHPEAAASPLATDRSAEPP
jgi:cytochrome c oxidase subunit IV